MRRKIQSQVLPHLRDTPVRKVEEKLDSLTQDVSISFFAIIAVKEFVSKPLLHFGGGLILDQIKGQ